MWNVKLDLIILIYNGEVGIDRLQLIIVFVYPKPRNPIP